MTLAVKICGLKTPETVTAAVNGGASFVGFVFFPRSPRAITPSEAAHLGTYVPKSVPRVGLVVDADDEALRTIVATAGLDMLQLHGSELPGRVAVVRNVFGLPVMKAIPIAEPGDVAKARAYETVADRLLFDAKPPTGADRPGGNARPFDWSLMAGTTWRVPWMLAGGLTANTLAEAVHVSGATAVDVSSGVEDAPGVKSVDRILAFLEASRAV